MKKQAIISVALPFVFVCMALLYTSCGMSDEERVAELVADETKKSLLIPESYDPVELECDSLFNEVFISDTNIRKADKVQDLSYEIEKKIPVSIHNYLFHIKEAKESGDYKRIKQEEEWLEEAKKEKMLKEYQWNTLFHELQTDYYEHNDFCGWIVYCKYRYKDNDGDIHFGTIRYILNADKTNIVRRIKDFDWYSIVKMSKDINEVGYKNYIDWKTSTTNTKKGNIYSETDRYTPLNQ